MTTETKNFYSASEAANLCGVSLASVSRWVHAGELKAYKIGRRVLIKSEDLEDFLSKHIIAVK